MQPFKLFKLFVIRVGDKKVKKGIRTPLPPLSIFHVVVDFICLETDFTLETNRKRVKEKLLKRT